MENGRVPLLPVDDMKNFLEKQHRERDALYEEVTNLWRCLYYYVSLNSIGSIDILLTRAPT